MRRERFRIPASQPNISIFSICVRSTARWSAIAGVYEIAGNLVTIRPVVAKIPVVMKPGAFEVYEFKVENNTLTLTQRRNVRGPVERGSVSTLTRVE
jgi:hypothetical protein